VALQATLADGSKVMGETRISRSRERIKSVQLVPRLAKPLPATLSAIAAADVITLGPGSLFTSVIPNLLVSGIPKAIQQSPAVKAYFVNLMWQPGETTDFTAADHILAIQKHGGKLLDYAVVNVRPIRQAARRRYERERASPVEIDIDRILKLGVKVMAANLVEHSERIRHDPTATAAVVAKLAQEGRRRRRSR
jgi:uncharacterized cofD-like protein